jgi:hypothetical protein
MPGIKPKIGAYRQFLADTKPAIEARVVGQLPGPLKQITMCRPETVHPLLYGATCLTKHRLRAAHLLSCITAGALHRRPSNTHSLCRTLMANLGL